MKILLNSSKMMLVLALMLSAVSSTVAGTLPDIVIRKLSEGRKVSVTINQLKTDATIQLIDADRAILADEKVSLGEPRVTKVFDLANLPEGKYSFVVSTSQKETVQPLEITAKDIVILEDQRQAYLVPMIRLGDDYVDVSWVSNGQASNLSVQITSLTGNTVFADQIRNTIKVERRYNLAQLERGEYTMIVSTPNNTQYKRLTIK